MDWQIKPFDWKKNPVYVSGAITSIFILIAVLLFYFNINQNFQIAGIVVALVSGGITFLFYQSQCPKCKRIFSLKKVSDEVIKGWEEPKQYKEKTIYYYSDGFTEKDVKYGTTKDFTARFEKHKDGFNCKICGETQYTPNKVTTSTKPPKVYMGFDTGAFEPTYYEDKGGKRKSIPSSVKKNLWIRYTGEKYKGPCFVCKEIIDIHNFEAGHVIPASKGGSDNISNLRPICKSCNRSMSDMDLNEFKRNYH